LKPLGFLDDKTSKGSLDTVHFPKAVDRIDGGCYLTETKQDTNGQNGKQLIAHAASSFFPRIASSV